LAGGGKALRHGEKVLTPQGFVNIEDIKIGDKVITPTNTVETVKNVWPQGEVEIYRITFQDSRTIDCCGEHLWKYHIAGRGNRDSKVGDTLSLKSIVDKEHSKESGERKRLPIIPLCEPVGNTTPSDLPIHPYVLGVILGDGCLSSDNTPRVTSMDDFIFNKIENLGYKLGSVQRKENNRAYARAILDIYHHVKDLGLGQKKSQFKFIPEVYKNSSIEDKFELVRGLMDTDGYVDDRGHMEYSSASKHLAEGVTYVARSLGSYATMTLKKDPKYTYNGEEKIGMDSHRIYIRSPYATRMVSLPRKRERCTDDYNGGKSPFGKVITNITPIGRQTSRCITVSDASGEYLTDDFTVTHNSYVGCYWILFNCFRFAKIKAVIARKTLKSLESSTWSTLRFIINDELGLIEKVHYREDKVKGVIVFWNGSSITKQELELLPSDPTYQRLGSNEYTIAFVDEVGEIVEKGVEVLYSRLRWRVAETFKVPKIFLSTNPVANWVRDRFVQDEEGNPVSPRRGDTFVQFSVFDNPSDNFVQVYASSLSNMRDEKEKMRLLYGNWDFLESSDNVIYNQFNGEKHLVTNLKKKKYNPLLPLILIYDFNVIPQMSVMVAQIDYTTKDIYILDEISGTPKEKTNSTPAVTRVVAKYIKALGHTGGIVISGDSTGAQRSAATEVDINNYTIIRSELQKEGIHSTQNVMAKNPPHKTRTEFINLILQGNTEWSIYIDLSCRKLTNDLMYQEKNPDGTKSKKKVIDPETGMKYEKYGHFSENLDYLICTFLQTEWNKYIDGD